MTTCAPNATPARQPEIATGSDGGAGDEQFPWDALVSRALHPIRVGTIEAFISIGLPLSPSDICLMFTDKFTASHVAYHVRVLVDHGILELVDTEPVRGGTRHLYVLAPESKWL